MKKIFLYFILFFYFFNVAASSDEISPIKKNFEEVFNVGKMISHDDKFTLYFRTREKAVLAKGLDSGSAYSILSIDIADVDVGQNIGAQLEADQAEADKKVAQAKAESRRAMAVAAEQENRARVEEMQAKVVESEAQVPLAMAEAFRSGNLGIMDYYNMKNVMADTSMRESLANDDDENDE